MLLSDSHRASKTLVSDYLVAPIAFIFTCFVLNIVVCLSDSCNILNKKKPCDDWFTTAETGKAHILEKHEVSTGCQTESVQRLQKRPAPSPHPSERGRQHYTQVRRPCWSPARGDEITTPALTVSSVAVKKTTTEALVLELHDNYELN